MSLEEGTKAEREQAREEEQEEELLRQLQPQSCQLVALGKATLAQESAPAGPAPPLLLAFEQTPTAPGPVPAVAAIVAALMLACAPSSKQFAEEVLQAHNDYRKKHGVPSLKLCKKLNQEAQQYSEALASTRILKHSPESSSGKFGENLAWASYDQSGKEVADGWYSEIKNYNYQNPGFSSGTGHFTAMVWKNTKKMGVGKAAASDGSTFVVARYEPAGNIVNPGHYEENVLPPKK
ncbi:hypothetical protein lerEdw1_001903 [Lerista edwardsae]|nr:hypothetical protein lerEdw1_001903 [Lerista edwardsae]